jgi:hypothetical protein
MTTGDQLMAWRRAREIVYDLRWLGVAIPPLYSRMADEFSAMVKSGEYTRWVASGGSGRGPTGSF